MTWQSMPLRSLLVWFLVVGVGVGMLAIQTATAQELPPFPYLYGGVALVDGVPAASGTVLTAHVGDWANGVSLQQGGTYSNLLVAPPDKSYYLKPVIFELNGLTAKEQDVFLPGNGPTFKDQGYVLHFVSQPLGLATPTPTATVGAAATVTPTPTVLGTPTPTLIRAAGQPAVGLWIVGVAGFLLAFAALAWYVLRRRR